MATKDLTKPLIEVNDTAQAVLRFYEDAKQLSRERIKRLRQDYRIRVNDLWNEMDHGGKPVWLSEPKMNFVVNQTEVFVAMMTANNPKFHVFGRNREDEIGAKKFNGQLGFWWDKERMRTKLKGFLENAVPYGTGISKLYLDPTAQNGLGEIKIKNCKPESILIDPDSESFEEAGYIIHHDWVDVSKIREMYNAKMEPESIRVSNIREKVRYQSFTGVGLPIRTAEIDPDGVNISTYDTILNINSSQYDPRYKPEEIVKLQQGKVLLIECWWQDSSTESFPLVERQQEAADENLALMNALEAEVRFNDDHKTHIEIHELGVEQMESNAEGIADVEGESQSLDAHIAQHLEYQETGLGYEGVRKKYPNGRLTVVTRDGRVVYDKPNPLELNPFTPFYFIKMPNEPWGMGLIQLQENNQIVYNKVRAKQVDMIKLLASPPLIFSSNAGMTLEDPVLKPWEIWTVHGNINDASTPSQC